MTQKYLKHSYMHLLVYISKRKDSLSDILIKFLPVDMVFV